MRGFEPRSIGPQLLAPADGWDPSSYMRYTNEGGNKELIGNLELEFPIFPQVNIRGVVFLDAGNAYGAGESFFTERYTANPENPTQLMKETFGGLYWSTGFGFRWFYHQGLRNNKWEIDCRRVYSEI